MSVASSTDPDLILLVISSPSGAGKTTLTHRLLQEFPELRFSVSHTTRKPRQNEVDGQDYHFVTEEAFRQVLDGDGFAEWAEVHGNLYGTRLDELQRLLDSGKDVVLELDVQGMQNLKAADLDVVTVFIEPPSMEELERRLRDRGTDSAADIELRLTNARAEMAARSMYDFVVVNGDLNEAVADFCAIVRAQRCRTPRHLQEQE